MSQNNLLVLSYWATLIEGMQASPQEFYKQVEEAVGKRAIPDITTSRVMWKESGILSADREYLRIRRGRYVFDICAAPFGNGFFFSSWMAVKLPSPLLALLALLTLPFAAFFLFVFFVYYGGIAGFLLWGFGLVIGLIVSLFFLVVTLSKEDSLFADHVFAIPYAGRLLERLCRPGTYFRYDSETMFRTATHNAMLEAVDATTKAQGAREITGDERKPILRDFFKRQG